MCQLKDWLEIILTISVLLPKENEYVNLQNFKRLKKATFKIYGDFECMLIPSIDNIGFSSNTKKYQDHVVCSYGYKLIYVGTYFGEDTIDKFLMW